MLKAGPSELVGALLPLRTWPLGEGLGNQNYAVVKQMDAGPASHRASLQCDILTFGATGDDQSQPGARESAQLRE